MIKEFTAVLNKEFKDVPRWRRASVSLKLLRFSVAHYHNTVSELVKIDQSINKIFTNCSYRTMRSKIRLLLDIVSEDGKLPVINVKPDELYLSWEEKKLIK